MALFHAVFVLTISLVKPRDPRLTSMVGNVAQAAAMLQWCIKPDCYCLMCSAQRFVALLSCLCRVCRRGAWSPCG